MSEAWTEKRVHEINAQVLAARDEKPGVQVATDVEADALYAEYRVAVDRLYAAYLVKAETLWRAEKG